MQDLTWMRDRVLAESPGEVLDVGGWCVPLLKLPADPDLMAYATGKPEHPAAFDKVITKGRWPRVDVVVAELAPPASTDLDKLKDLWDRMRKAARKTLLVHVPFGQGNAFESDAAVHQALPGIVASDGRGLYAVSPLGRTGS